MSLKAPHCQGCRGTAQCRAEGSYFWLLYHSSHSSFDHSSSPSPPPYTSSHSLAVLNFVVLLSLVLALLSLASRAPFSTCFCFTISVRLFSNSPSSFKSKSFSRFLSRSTRNFDAAVLAWPLLILSTHVAQSLSTSACTLSSTFSKASTTKILGLAAALRAASACSCCAFSSASCSSILLGFSQPAKRSFASRASASSTSFRCLSFSS
mmetsp:Transcript_47882/g.138507  ORF Transcript_47882/g.138507 Transcript_47882/m.138507 type:complete len:208 (-) Transcript_47882:365-988(-)